MTLPPLPNLCKEELKISFFKLSPGPRIESKLKKDLIEAVGSPNNISTYKALGIYDVITFYPKNLEDEVRNRGTIYGIRGFTSDEGICWGENNPGYIIDDLNSKRFLCIISTALLPSSSTNNYGLYRVDIAEIANASQAIYLNSTSHPDQKIIVAENSMEELKNKTINILTKIRPFSLDLNATLGINLNFIEAVERGEAGEDWNENISAGYDVRWKVKFWPQVKQKLSSTEIKEILNNTTAPTLECDNPYYSFDLNEIVFPIKKGEWSTLIKNIRRVRNKYRASISSTSLTVRINDQILNLPSGNLANVATPKEYDFKLSKRECSRIVKNLGSRIGNIIIQALYAISNLHATGLAVQFALESLSRSAEYLKKLSLYDSKKMDFDPTYLQMVCLEEADRIIKSVRQRTGTMPSSRDYNFVSFDIPPINVRLYCEACQLIVEKICNELAAINHYVPHVIFEDVDYPEHALLSVILPVHIKDSLHLFTAISHESLHVIVQSTVDKYNFPVTKEIFRYIEDGSSAFYDKKDTDRNKFITEVLVEMLDYEITYLGDENDYTNHIWTFFAHHFIHLVRRKMKPTDLIKYIIRTFIVFLYHTIKDNKQKKDYASGPLSISSYLEVPSLLRAELTRYIDKCFRICSAAIDLIPEENRDLIDEDHFINLRNGIWSTKRELFKIQAYLESMSYAIESAFEIISALVHNGGKFNLAVKQMKEWRDSPEFAEFVTSINNGIPIFSAIKYPHLLATKVVDNAIKNAANYANQSTISRALLISLYNAHSFDK